MTAEETMMSNVPPPPQTTIVHSRRVSCDGEQGALGHPRVWMEIDERGYADCVYCDRRFVLAGEADSEQN